MCRARYSSIVGYVRALIERLPYLQGSPFAWVRNLILFAGIGVFVVAASYPAQAEYWHTRYNGKSVQGPDGCALALEQLIGIYGIPKTLTGCDESLGASGLKTCVAIYGYGNVPFGGQSSGFACLECEAGEIRTAQGCEKLPDLERGRSISVPNDRSCGDVNSVGNPITVLTGRKIEHITDFTTTGPSKLSFERYYRSPGFMGIYVNTRSAIGQNWVNNFDAKAYYYTSFNSIYQFDAVIPDGRDFHFKVTSSGMEPIYYDSYYKLWYKGSQGKDAVAVKYSDRIELTVDGSTTYIFGKNTKLIAIRYLGGYDQNLSYNADGQLILVTDNFNRTLKFSYNEFGYVSQVAVPDGQIYKYEYNTTYDVTELTKKFPDIDFSSLKNSKNTLSKVILPSSVNENITYHYEDSSDPTLLTGITNERGIRYATWAYDKNKRAILSTHDAGADKTTLNFKDDVNQVVVTNPLGRQTVYNYSLAQKSIRRLDTINGQASPNCPASSQSFTYDANSFVTSRADENGNVTNFVNDNRGRATSTTFGSGSSTPVSITTTWHSIFNVPTQIVRPGLTTDYTWNTLGQLEDVTETDTTKQTLPYTTAGQTRIWHFTYGTGGLLTSVDGPLLGGTDTVTYGYDASGFLQSITNQLGQITTISSVNSRGQPTRTQDPNGLIAEFQYDALGRLTTVIKDPAGLAAQTTFAYDATGNVIKATDPDGSFFAMQYDGNNRLTELKDNDDQVISYTYDLMGNKTSVEAKNAKATLYFKRQQKFDELGRLLRVIRTNNASWTYGYDKVGNVTSLTEPNGNASAAAYDALNRLASTVDENGAARSYTFDPTNALATETDPRSLVTTYVNNGWGEVIQEQSADAGTLVFTRDQTGQITSKTDARGVVSNYSRDVAGRLISTKYPSDPTLDVLYTYDSAADGNTGIGRLTNVSDAAGKVHYLYDVLGRRTSETRSIDGKDYTTGYQYDAAGNISQITYPSGRIVGYERTPTGAINQVWTNESATSPKVSINDWATNTPFGPLSGIGYANGLVDTRTFTEDGDIQTQTLQDGTKNLISRSYGYQDNRNLTAITDNLDAKKSETYSYKNNGFIQTAKGPWGELTFSIDAAGNITQKKLGQSGTDRTDTYAIPDTSNRLNSVSTDGILRRSFDSDAAGNIVTDTGQLNRTYVWNAAGLLAQALNSGTPVGTYRYDYANRQVVRSPLSTGPTIHSIHDQDDRLIAEYDSTGKLYREYIWLDNRPLAIIAQLPTGPAIWNIHTDHLQRPILMTDEAKAKVWEAIYLPFGETYQVSGTASQDLRFPGQWYQPETGLHNNWNRHYDPTIGRYLQPDPLGTVDGNRWAYGQNSPLMNIDPRGTQVIVIPNGRPLPWLPGKPLNCTSIALCLCTELFSAANKAIINSAMSGDDDGQRKSKTPNTGTPGSKHINPGSGQVREYGADGKPKKDIDYDHDHGQGVPHVHDWEYDSNGKPNRKNGRPFDPVKDN